MQEWHIAEVRKINDVYRRSEHTNLCQKPKKYHRECFTLISAYEGKPTGFGETEGELVCFSFSSPFDTCWLVQGAFWDTWLSQVHTSHLSASSVNGADQNHIWGFEVDMARCKL